MLLDVLMLHTCEGARLDTATGQLRSAQSGSHLDALFGVLQTSKAMTLSTTSSRSLTRPIFVSFVPRLAALTHPPGRPPATASRPSMGQVE